MGLASFWASITAPRVKEIACPSDDFWPERGRPIDASGFRTSKRTFGRTPRDSARRPAASSSNGETRRERLVRSLSRPRRLYAGDAKAAQSQSCVVARDKYDEDLPSVPSLPANLLWNDNSETASSFNLLWNDKTDTTSSADPDPEDIGRPGTAITTEGLQALSIFELPAEPSPPAKTPVLYATAPPRARSKSFGQERRSVSSLKKASGSYFGTNDPRDKALPPPPPPTCPLPPVPTTAPITPRRPLYTQSRAQSVDGQINAPKRPSTAQPRAQSMGNQMPAPALPQHRDITPPRPVTAHAPSTSIAKSSLDSDSLLEAFPAVPGLVHDYDDPDASEPSIASSEVWSLYQPGSPGRDRATVTGVRDKQSPTPIRISSAQVHKHKDSAIGTPRSPQTPTGFHRWTRQYYAGGSSGGEEEGFEVPSSPATTAASEVEGWSRPRTDSDVIPIYEVIAEHEADDQVKGKSGGSKK